MDDGRYCDDDDDDDNEDNVLSSCDSDLTVITICSGLIRAASREIFGHVVDLTVQSTETEDMGHDKTQQHTVFNLHFADLCVLPSSGPGNATGRATPTDQSRSPSVTWGGYGRCSANGFVRSRANHGGLVSESRTVALTEVSLDVWPCEPV